MAVDQFATTHWSVIAAARDGDTTAAQKALAELCQVYWYPLYAYIRQQGHAWDKAQDLTQAFFTCLLEKDVLADVDRSQGRFRAFLIAACGHFLSNERDRERALKRGGDRRFIPIDFHSAEQRYKLEPTHSTTAEKVFERRWTLTLLDHVLTQLRQEYAGLGKSEWFEALKPFLMKQPDREARYRDLAARFATTESAVKVAVHRLRQRYREILRAEISRTIPDDDHVDDEIRSLFAALAR